MRSKAARQAVAADGVRLAASDQGILRIAVDQIEEIEAFGKAHRAVALVGIFSSHKETQLVVQQRTAQGSHCIMMTIGIGAQKLFTFIGKLVGLHIQRELILIAAGAQFGAYDAGIGPAVFRGIPSGQHLKFFHRLLDDVQRLRIGQGIDRGSSVDVVADLIMTAAADMHVPVLHHHAVLGGNDVVESPHRHVFQVVGSHQRDALGDVFFHQRFFGGDHHRLSFDGGLAEIKIDLGGDVGRDPHFFHEHILVADKVGPHRVGAHRHVQDDEVTIDITGRAHGGAFQADVYPRQRLVGAFVFDHPDQLAGRLAEQQRRERYQQQYPA